VSLQDENNKERELIIKIGKGVFERLLKEFESFSGLGLESDQRTRINEELEFLEHDYFNALERSLLMARVSYDGGSRNKTRIRFNNPKMNDKFENLSKMWPNSANGFVIGGLLFKNQIAGLKNLYGFDADAGEVLDVMGSATSVALGGNNPYVTIFDRVEDVLKVRDNMCCAYHPGIRQAFFLNKIAALYPPKNAEVVIHSESSGAVVDSIAIESALAYIEARTGNVESRILAIDGTWAGGHGTAREATGFDVDSFSMKRVKKNVYVDRCLPSPTKENAKSFLDILKQKVNEGKAAGLYLEPDIIGDSGIEVVDSEVLREALSILSTHQLPVIADCVQQLGRTGGYWGENVETVLRDYPLLILTTAKSASNGLAFGYTIMPKVVGDSSYPLSHVSTNQFNGPLLRAIAVSEIMSDENLQKFIVDKGNKIEEIAQKYNITLGDKGLRGKYMNRAIYVDNNENVKLMQIALLIEDGILIGALPQSLRYQPMLLEHSKTNELVAEIIFRRISEIKKGNVSKDVEEVFDKMKGMGSGLAR